MMRREPLATAGSVMTVLPLEQRCPFYDGAQSACRASRTRYTLNRRGQSFCCSDDYDDCPNYLAHLLRRSRALRSDCDWLDAM